MQFAILTTTHKRPAELLRAIVSVQNQKYTEYIQYIVNDSPEYDYSEVEQVITSDSKIVYTKNTENIGKNASLNSILQTLRSTDFNGYIVYLDDDDWLTPNCLQDFTAAITKNKTESASSQWFVSNRSLESDTSLTQNNTGKQRISYFFDYLLFKRLKGDATHCIVFSPAHLGSHSAHFPITIKNGEEWYYFLQLARKYESFVYINQIGTYTNGYQPDGQNAAMQVNYKQNTLRLWREQQSLLISVYLLLRLIKTLFRK
jgi:glycosyltransferase involved in cell wall biosynthesis